MLFVQKSFNKKGNQAGKIIPVILSGGSGTRLWPLSRDLFPKQLISLTGKKSLLAETIRRVSLRNFAPPLIICNYEHRFMVAEQLDELGVEPLGIILEPVAKNTAAAIAAAAAYIDDEEAILLVLPSDHLINKQELFEKCIAQGMEAAKKNLMVTFGINPVREESGYGYIKPDFSRENPKNVFAVERFVEKPESSVLKDMLKSGKWYWNSGIFMFKSGEVLNRIEKYAPEIASAAKNAVKKSYTDLSFTCLNKDEFEKSPSLSIDHAVMEKTDNAAVCLAEFDWSDIGSWQGMWEIGDKDNQGNVVKGDVVSIGNSNCYLHSDASLITALGLEDIIVVAAKDTVLVASRDKAQEVKKIVGDLKEKQRPEASTHTISYRPWGNYEVIDSGLNFKVKRITVKPGARLSLQKHQRRAEHWIVISGTATVIKGEEILTLQKNMSVDIPIGIVHRLENQGLEILNLIEVQSGDYLEEDDITRLEDDYGKR